MIGLDIGIFMSGIVVVESVYGWPGIGQLTWQAIQQIDWESFSAKEKPLKAGKAWQKKKQQGGWACLHWPKEYGGGGLDMAFWDALGHAAGTTVVQLLGGSPRPIPAYDSFGIIDPAADGDALARSAAAGPPPSSSMMNLVRSASSSDGTSCGAKIP